MINLVVGTTQCCEFNIKKTKFKTLVQEKHGMINRLIEYQALGLIKLLVNYEHYDFPHFKYRRNINTLILL